MIKSLSGIFPPMRLRGHGGASLCAAETELGSLPRFLLGKLEACGSGSKPVCDGALR
jgi:hypothetical protein